MINFTQPTSKPNLLLIDFDLTLFDTVKYRVAINESFKTSGLSEEEIVDFWKIERELRNKEHYLAETIKQFCEKYERIDQREDFFQALLHQEFDAFLFGDVKNSLAELRENTYMVLFSQGDELFQNVKIFQTRVVDMVDQVAVYDNKMQHLSELIESLPKFEQIYYMDDRTDLLHQAKNLMPDLQTIHIVRYPFRKNQDLEFKPDIEGSNLTECLTAIKNHS